MPMSLTVTRNRKRSRNFNSEGHGVSISVELDQALLTRPGDLRQQIDHLYAEAEAALDRQTADEPDDPARGVPTHNGNGNGRSGNGNTSTRLTASRAQRRAIRAIARDVGVDPTEACRAECGVEVDDLDMRQASQLIDHLRSLADPTY